MRKSVSLVVSLAVAGTMAGGYMVAHARTPNPSLLSGIYKMDQKAAEQSVLARLRPRYAVGAPEAGLAMYLESEGLKTRRFTTSGSPEMPIYGEAIAHANWPPICRKVAFLSWRANKAGVLQKIEARLQEEGCP